MMSGEIWWVDFQEPRGSTPAFVRPGIIVQNNELNESDLNSTIVIPITTNCRLADYKGNIRRDFMGFRKLIKLNYLLITNLINLIQLKYIRHL